MKLFRPLVCEKLNTTSIYENNAAFPSPLAMIVRISRSYRVVNINLNDLQM
jgi:hypothetical protein